MKDVLEGELVNSNRKISNKKDEPFSLKLPILKILICLVPLLGLIFGISWFYYSRKNNNFEIIFSIIGIVLSIFSTITFFTLRFILKSIF